jgi:hypothetical protein
MVKKLTWAELLLVEAQMRGTIEEHLQRRLRWEDWDTLLPEAIG